MVSSILKEMRSNLTYIFACIVFEYPKILGYGFVPCAQLFVVFLGAHLVYVVGLQYGANH